MHSSITNDIPVVTMMCRDRMIARSQQLKPSELAMADMTNRRLIIAKGFLFLTLGLFASIILICLTLSWQVAILLAISVWSFCRFYYFAFYVIEQYVDSDYRFRGLVDFARRFVRGDIQSNARDSLKVEACGIEDSA